MSKQLKEVIYLNEQDRPKQPLSYTEWLKKVNHGKYPVGNQEWDKSANEYCDYRNSFNAEVKEVEFTHVLMSPINGWMEFDKSKNIYPIKGVKEIEYRGFYVGVGELFEVTDNAGDKSIYLGHLNSGFYTVNE